MNPRTTSPSKVSTFSILSHSGRAGEEGQLLVRTQAGQQRSRLAPFIGRLEFRRHETQRFVPGGLAIARTVPDHGDRHAIPFRGLGEPPASLVAELPSVGLFRADPFHAGDAAVRT